MPNWVTVLDNLKSWVEAQPTLVDRQHGRKLVADVESAIHYEMRTAPGKEEGHNYVAMSTSPDPSRALLQRPDLVCAHCEITMRITKSEGNWIVDHGEHESGCPNSCRMWKVKAESMEIQQEMLVPPFVREAMAKNS